MASDFYSYLSNRRFQITETSNLNKKNSVIKANDPVRNDIAEIQRNKYWQKPGKALTSMQNVLDKHGYLIEDVPSFSVSDKSQSHTQRFNLAKYINPEKPNEGYTSVDNMLVFSWHWLGDPNNPISDESCEVVAYIS
jgi:hypothetical protein